MGFALAEAASRLGANVTLITGPVHLETPVGVSRIDVGEAAEMFEAVHQSLDDTDLFIGAAAVCDMRPSYPSASKLKKFTDDLSQITLTKNPDIIQSVANAKNRPNLVVGFAAETDDMLAHAARKLTSKSLDIIIANCVENGRIFGQDDTQATILSGHGDPQTVSGSKSEVAIDILNTLSDRLNTRI
jgi:phosphopantothenoylcysteine decarboxylase/phosphopantothenate--cysteine ligase